MIVRCSNCNSAFAVDDAKVENKKFAFTCPKCDNENVLDNRTRRKPASIGPSVIDESYLNGDAARSGVAGGDRGKDSFLHDSGKKEKNGIGDDTDPLLADSSFSDSDDLSGLAEPDILLDTDGTIDLADLPPADDMRSDVSLDDLSIDEMLDEMDSPEKEDAAAAVTRPRSDEAMRLEGDWAGIEKEIDGFQAESATIRDELEPIDADGVPVELEEMDDIDAILAEDDKKAEIIDDFEPLSDETINDNDDEIIDGSGARLDGEIKTEEMYRAGDDLQEESITIDLDTLDIDLDDKAVAAAPRSAGDGAATSGTTTVGRGADDRRHEDENITIDLDSLDIDLQEGDEIVSREAKDDLDLDLSDFSDETIRELEDVSQPRKTDHDEDITLDLDTLDISLEESDGFKDGEVPDHDEKLTLEDAGLTMDELTADDLSMVSETSEDEEEEIRLTLDEIDADLDMHSIDRELKEAESILGASRPGKGEPHIIEELSDLPDIDFDDGMAIPGMETGNRRKSRAVDELIGLDEERGTEKKWGLQKELPDMVTRGAVNFSIDYSIKYSRIGALLRIFGLFFIGLIPHYLVFFVYALLSLILGVINHIVVIATRRSVEDFSGIHENTLRYLLSINASMTGVVEEMPIFAGRDNIDYPLQMKIIYPLHSSRVMALLRLSGIGIIVLVLPHLLVLGLMSVLTWPIYFIGIISVLIFGRWPHMLFEFITRYYRYTARVLAFSIGIVDVYPRFTFE